MKQIIGIDLGGTTIKGGLIAGEKLVREEVADTRAEEGGEVTLAVLKEVIGRLKTEDTSAIGIGVPSVVDRTRGVVYNVQNIRNWEEIHLSSFPYPNSIKKLQILQSELNHPGILGAAALCY
jgi:glucokinase